jgi:hypothetical protein
MKNYKITNLNEQSDYIALVTMYNSESPLTYLSDIEEELLNQKKYGDILIDQILHSGNTEDRFILASVTRYGIDEHTIKYVYIEKSSDFRKLSCSYLRSDCILEFSILSSIQKKMIAKGISI